MSVNLTDQQRRAAVETLGGNLALRSGAGCGKTLVLACRYCHLLAAQDEPDRAVSRLIALTFTEKAAMEMAQRVRRLLRQEAAAQDGPGRRQRLAWIDQLADAQISTIHGFCATLLRGRAVEAGVDPAFAVCADSMLRAQLQEEAIETALLESVESGLAGTAEMLAEVPFSRVKDWLGDLLDNRTFAGEPPEDPGQILEGWRQELLRGRERAWRELETDADLRASLERLEGESCGDESDKFQQCLREQTARIRELLEDRQARTPGTFAELKTAGNVGSGKRWGKERLKRLRDELRRLVNALKEYAPYAEELHEADERAARHLATCARLARAARERHQAGKRRRGLLDFEDLLVLARRLLEDRPAVARGLRERTHQLLIDEAQDTDAFQAALLEMLIHGGSAEDALPPGRLFVVGDAKQSIYRFRGADVEKFRALCRRIGPQGQQELSVSFRTHAAGVELANHIFPQLMGADFQPLTAHRQDLPPRPAAEVLLAAEEDGSPLEDDARESARRQGRVLAARLAEMFSSGEKRVRDRETGEWRPARFGDVAVLFSRMTHTEPYERELQRAQIPYHVIGGAGFFQREEVTDLLNALQAIETPFDDVAVAGVLRSGLCGLDDNDLTRLGRALRGSWLPALQAAFDGENVPLRRSIEQALTTSRRAALERTVSLLGRLRAAKDALGPARILAELIDGTGFEAQLAGQFEGRRQVGNVRKLEALARSADRSGLNLAAFIEQVRSQALQQQREEQAQVVSENEDVVRLMTIHCAKGLEFPVVVLPDLDAGGGRATPLLACEGWGWVLNASPDDAAAKQASVPLSHALALREDKRRQREEAVRRFYVAVTRHEDFLIFLAPYRRHKELDTLGRPHTPLHWLGQVFSLEAAMRAGRTELPYGPAGEYRLAVRVETGRRPEPLGTPRESPLAKAGLLTAGPESLAETLRCEGSLTDPAGVGDNARLALLGPLGPHIGRGALAVTALNVFRSCPQRFRWEYELRCPAPPAGPGRAPAGVDAAEEGTFYHQCMERLEWDEADPAAAARRAAQEVPLPAGGQPDVLIARLAEMLKTLRESELGGRIASARRRLPEVDFLLEVGPLTLRGQIDLLFQDARGRWAVVDYKSDRVAGGEIADRGGHYRLQLLTYALAAQRHLGEEIAEAGLYFLRPGALWRAECDPGALAGADAKLRELGEALLAARRSGSWPRRDDENCRSCPYAGLCAGLCAARGAPVPPTAGTC